MFFEFQIELQCPFRPGTWESASRKKYRLASSGYIAELKEVAAANFLISKQIFMLFEFAVATLYSCSTNIEKHSARLKAKRADMGAEAAQAA